MSWAARLAFESARAFFASFWCFLLEDGPAANILWIIHWTHLMPISSPSTAAEKAQKKGSRINKIIRWQKEDDKTRTCCACLSSSSAACRSRDVTCFAKSMVFARVCERGEGGGGGGGWRTGGGGVACAKTRAIKKAKKEGLREKKSKNRR